MMPLQEISRPYIEPGPIVAWNLVLGYITPSFYFTSEASMFDKALREVSGNALFGCLPDGRILLT